MHYMLCAGIQELSASKRMLHLVIWGGPFDIMRYLGGVGFQGLILTSATDILTLFVEHLNMLT